MQIIELDPACEEFFYEKYEDQGASELESEIREAQARYWQLTEARGSGPGSSGYPIDFLEEDLAPLEMADIGRRRRHSLHIGDKRAGLAAAAFRHSSAAECYRRGICLVALNGTSPPNKPKA